MVTPIRQVPQGVIAALSASLMMPAPGEKYHRLWFAVSSLR